MTVHEFFPSSWKSVTEKAILRLSNCTIFSSSICQLQFCMQRTSIAVKIPITAKKLQISILTDFSCVPRSPNHQWLEIAVIMDVHPLILEPSHAFSTSLLPIAYISYMWQGVHYLTNSMAYGTRKFNAAFTRALQWSQSCAESTQFLILIPISLRSIVILSSHLRLGLPKGFFPVGLPALLPSSVYFTCPS